jgi:hypothetical protein
MGIVAKKLTSDELQIVKDLKQEYTNLAFTLGELEIQKVMLLDTQKELASKEKQIAKQLQEKYGEGTIDLETGEVKA